MTTYNSKTIQVGGKDLEVFASSFRLVGDATGRWFRLDRVSPASRPVIEAAMSEMAQLDAVDPAVLAHEAEQRRVDDYDPELVNRALVRGY
jgi:hypothetical protein